MNNNITCPKCGESFALDAVLTHQIEEQVIASERSKHSQELAKVRVETEEKAIRKAKEQFEIEAKSLKEASIEDKDRNKKLIDQIEILMKELRTERHKNEDARIEMEKKLAIAEEKSRLEAQQKANETHYLKDKEKEKVIADLRKDLADMTRKAEQGSQQTQGEVLELEIESLLRREFPIDEISEVKKGVKGADVTQLVIDKKGRSCGIILWESKNGNWQNTWIQKFKQDAREARAHLAVLVASNPPENIDSFSYLDGVWVVKRSFIIPLATALRYNLVVINDERTKEDGKKEKAEVLYQYVTSHEFRDRIEAITEAFTSMQDEIEKEKRWFNSKWSRQEKQIRAVIDNTQGMYSDMQGYVGKVLPNLSQLELPE